MHLLYYVSSPGFKLITANTQRYATVYHGGLIFKDTCHTLQVSVFTPVWYRAQHNFWVLLWVILTMYNFSPVSPLTHKWPCLTSGPHMNTQSAL